MQKATINAPVKIFNHTVRLGIAVIGVAVIASVIAGLFYLLALGL